MEETASGMMMMQAAANARLEAMSLQFAMDIEIVKAKVALRMLEMSDAEMRDLSAERLADAIEEASR